MPFAADCSFRDVQHFGDFFDFESAEKPQFDDARLLPVKGFQQLQRIVESNEIDVTLDGETDGFVKREFAFAAPAFLRPVFARVVNEDVTHHLRRDVKEVRAVLPFHRFAADKPQVCFVDERGGLKRVVRAFVTQMILRQPAQFFLDTLEQRIRRLRVAATDFND